MKNTIIIVCFLFFSSLLKGQNIYDELFIKAITDEKINDASYWLEKGANINWHNKEGLSSIYYAISKDNLDLCEWLIR